MTDQLTAELGKVQKDTAPPLARRVQEILDGLDLDRAGYEAFAELLRDELAALFLDGAQAAAEQVPGAPPVPPGTAVPIAVAPAGPLELRIGVDAFAQVNEAAVEYARQRSAEMVGMRWVDGQLVPNPNAVWRIDESTREMLRADVTRALQEGWSNDRLAQALERTYAFSEARAETVARTETARADVEGTLEGYEALGVERKQWLTAPMCCDACADLDGKTTGLKGTFPGGVHAPPLHPNCFSGDTVVAAEGVTAYFKRWFRGEVVVIHAAGLDDITVTPNHPVLTARGWVAAGSLKVGDELVQCLDPRAALAGSDPDHDYIEARFEQVAGAALVAGGVAAGAVPVAPEHFHGDGIADTEVDVVRPAGALADDGAQGQQGFPHCALCGRELGQGEGALPTDGGVGQGLGAAPRAADRIVGGGDEPGALRGGGAGEAGMHGGAVVTNRQAHPLPAVAQGAAVATDAPSYVHARLAGHVAAVKVTGLVRSEYNGHVYNLSTTTGWYIAGGIVAHNCRCDVLPVLDDDE